MNEKQDVIGICCQACAWWSELPEEARNGSESRQGLCHRYPPQVVVMHVLTLTGEKETTGTAFPQMRSTDWCAEFVVRKQQS